jgi:hypothetical protein
MPTLAEEYHRFFQHTLDRFHLILQEREHGLPLLLEEQTLFRFIKLRPRVVGEVVSQPQIVCVDGQERLDGKPLVVNYFVVRCPVRKFAQAMEADVRFKIKSNITLVP